MPGYCGKCQKRYRESAEDHELNCNEGFDPANIQGTPENFERERRQNDWDDDYAREVWDKHYR